MSNPQKRMGLGMLLATWVLIMVMGTFWFQDYLNERHNPNERIDGARLADGRVTIMLDRNRYGHYVASGTINGIPVVFLVDTGATTVAVPERLARHIGLERGRPIAVVTANGTARAYVTRLDEVALGELRLRNVRASINPGMKSDEVLLGMSFLKHLYLTQQGDRMTLSYGD